MVGFQGIKLIVFLIVFVIIINFYQKEKKKVGSNQEDAFIVQQALELRYMGIILVVISLLIDSGFIAFLGFASFLMGIGGKRLVDAMQPN